VNALQLHWWVAIAEMLFVITLVLLHFHCVLLYPGFVELYLWCLIASRWNLRIEGTRNENFSCENASLLLWNQSLYFLIMLCWKFFSKERSSWNQLRKRERKPLFSVPSTMRNCAIPRDNLRSEISFSRTCNIPNLISYIYNRALVAFVTLETFHFCVSTTWLSKCMRTKTNICLVQNFLEGTLLLVQKLGVILSHRSHAELIFP